MSQSAVSLGVPILTLMILAASFQSPPVEFWTDNTRLKSITVADACILGDDIRTTGAYLIGSADGSDAQGHSIISVGSSGQRMKSDDPRQIIAPEFQMRFERRGLNRLGFSVSVGPVPQDFATISFPFDFGLKMMDRFSFAGDQYRIFSSENNGVYKGSSATFASIQPHDEIRDVKNTLIGKVGGASTDAPSAWGEVDGPYATVRVNVSASTHYKSLVFMNHPGTHNLEFSFGKMLKGETASISGEIVVTPKAGPNSWTFNSATEFNHQIGRAEADGWSVTVGDPTDRYMCFGPYATEIGAGLRYARFAVLLDNVDADNERILTLDVADATTGTVLASRDVTRQEFLRPMQYQAFVLAFQAPRRGKLEFRTQWHGVSYARMKNVVITK